MCKTLATTLVLAALATAGGAGAQAARVDQFAWLTGCWGFDTGNGYYEEMWTRPSGNAILGLSRRVDEGFTREYEYLRIVTSGGGGFNYVAQPKDNPETTFSMLSLNGTKAVFENPDNPFPSRIIYEFVAPDSLNARIEGTYQGRPRAMNFPMKRRACP